MGEIPKDLRESSYLGDLESLCNEISKRTNALLNELGQTYLIRWNRLATGLSYLDRLASCAWGCAGRDQSLQYLAGHGVRSAQAGIALLKSGYYDECLIMARRSEEVANLLLLLAVDGHEARRWISNSKKSRGSNFSASEVRHRLGNHFDRSPFDGSIMAALSDGFVHPSAAHAPDTWGILKTAATGPGLDATKVVTCINETSRPICFSLAAAAGLLGTNEEVKKIGVRTALELLETVGGLTFPRATEAFRLAGRLDEV
jgi:hypothetical protein